MWSTSTLSDSHQQDQLPSGSDENSPSQQDQSLCENLECNHPSSSLEHTFSHMETLSHPKFDVLKNVHIYRRHQRNVGDHHRKGHVYILQILVIPRKRSEQRSKKNSQRVLTLLLRKKKPKVSRCIHNYTYYCDFWIIIYLCFFGLLMLR